MHLVLIGLRCSGKSTLGPMIAERLGMPFVELDDRTAEALGARTPGEALSVYGEPAFRDAERGALGVALAEPDAVIALGGGTPTAPGARESLDRARDADRARIVYLRATPSELALRLQRTDLGERPSLTGKGAIEELAELHAERDPIYRRLADAIVETGAGQVADHVRRVVERAAELGVVSG